MKESTSVHPPPASTAQRQATGLHLIGDLHQPMHVGGGGDQGGNFCKVTWHGRATNLHRVWDSDMIGQTDLSFTELAAFASEGRSREQAKAWQAGTPRDWAAESRKLRAESYPPEVVAPTAPVSRLTYCERNVAPEAMPNLGYEYSYRFLPAVHERIYLGGVRLARLLEQALQFLARGRAALVRAVLHPNRAVLVHVGLVDAFSDGQHQHRACRVGHVFRERVHGGTHDL